ncbi:hypothetical protein ElyMa_006762800 [Elysia marginata]|uniref:Reverse transcriptase domain-containing protein n=1 Tax=Elysia marginata TaxID=1093978 RepID=A0AAV4J288_9GAST|nr:hypothetical protein ElyMa_006762800 [Elysia marginata]
MVSQFHDGMQVQALDDGEPSDPFSCFQRSETRLRPRTDSLQHDFSAMLTDAFNADTPGIDIRNRTDGKLYSPRRLQAKTKVHTDRLRDFLFADDCALNDDNEADMQHSMNFFSTACNNFGITISIKKTEVMYQPAPGARSHGSQKKRFKDTLKASMKDLNIDPTLWEAPAQNRPVWRVAVTKGAKTYKHQRLQAAKTKRPARKARANCNPTLHSTAAPWTCPHCNRDFWALIGLTSHPEPTDDPTSPMTIDEDGHLLQRWTDTRIKAAAAAPSH